MIEFHRVEGDGVVVVLDFTRGPDVALPALFASPRATTSSRTPGRVNRGTIYTAKSKIEACPLCGRMQRAGPGVHAPHHGAHAGQVIDCTGRPCVRDAAGHYQLAEASL